MRPLASPLGAQLLPVAAIVSSAAVAQAARTEELNMSVGEELTIKDVKEFAVENQNILKAEASKDGKNVILRAVRAGTSKVLLRPEVGDSRTLDIMVAPRDPRVVQKELENLLRNYPDVTLRTNRTQIIIEGGVKSDTELVAIREIERRYEGQVSNLVSVGPSGLRRNVMVRLDLHYVQVRRRLQRNLGLRYPPQINGGLVTNFVVNTITMGPDAAAQAGLISNLMPSLDINETNGYLKVMRIDTLITENGAKATYRSGSELPVRLVGSLGAGTLEKMFFGSELTVTPRLTSGNEAVSLEITANISVKDTAAQDGIPGRTLDFINTSVHIPMGQSVMLAGLDLRTVNRSTNGLPWLNRIPVLGYLFGTESKDAESAYGVIYITPTLIQDGPAQFKPYIEQALRYFEKPGALPR